MKELELRMRDIRTENHTELKKTHFGWLVNDNMEEDSYHEIEKEA